MELHATPTTPGNTPEMKSRGQHTTASVTMPLPALAQSSDRPTAADPRWDNLKQFPRSLSTPLPHAVCLSCSNKSISSLLLCNVRLHLPLLYASAGHAFGTGAGGGSRRDGNVQSSGFSPSLAAISSWALYLYLKLSPALRSGISLVNIVKWLERCEVTPTNPSHELSSKNEVKTQVSEPIARIDF